MKTTLHKLSMAAFLAAAFASGTVRAALPPPTPAQQQAAAAKKAQADAQTAKDKESLASSMDALAARWRARAAQQGWKSHPPVAIAAAPAAPGAPAVAAGVANPASGTPPVSRAAEAANNVALGATPGSGAAPLSPEALAAAKVPVKSEKLGTAPPSRDVKAGPTQPVPHGTGPTVQKGSPDASKK
jgi:hypothetical protein